MVCRGIAERGHDDCVVRHQSVFRGASAGEANRKGGPHGLWQVARNGRGLRRDHQRARPQNLMPPTRNRIFGRGGEAEQHVTGRVLPRNLKGARDLERRIAVVQESHVGRTQRGRDRRHPLMSRRADGVEALSGPLHDPRLPVERARQTLGAEKRDRKISGQRAIRGAASRKIPRGEAAQEILVDDIGAVHSDGRPCSGGAKSLVGSCG